MNTKISAAAYVAFLWLMWGCTTLNAQVLNKINWDTLKVYTETTDSLFTEYDNYYTQHKSKFRFIAEEKVLFTQLLQIKINSEAGAKYFEGFCFPESFDPISDYYFLPDELKGKVALPLPKGATIKEAGARKILPGGSTAALELDTIISTESTFSPAGRITISSTKFFIQNVKKGDEIQLFIQLELPAKEVAAKSKRYFFSQKFPCRNFSLEFLNNSTYPVLNCIQVNSAASYSKKANSAYNLQHYTWEAQDLIPLQTAGCFRPVKEFSFVCMYLTQKWNNEIRQQAKWRDLMESEVKTTTQLLKYIKYKPKEYLNKQTSLIEFCNEQKKKMSDTGSVALFSFTHNQITKEFGTYSLLDRYENRDTTSTSEKVFSKKLIDELNVNHLYSDLLNITGNEKKYRMAEILDTRTENIDTNVYFPYKASLSCYVLGDNNQDLFFVIPKQPRFNHFANELPFYLEKSPAIIQDIKLGQSSSYSMSIMTTPESSPSDNLRQTIFEASIDSTFSNCSFDGKIQLSGQFSTLTRNFYKNGSFNAGVNPAYFKKPFPVINVITDKKEEITSVQEYFPFKTEIAAGFRSKDMIQREQNKVVIDLRGIINHVIWQNALLSDSVQNFYNDFKFKDVYRIKLNIPSGYRLSKENISSFKIKNEYGKYEFKLIQINEITILVESSFFSDIDQLAGSKKNRVAEIYTAIQKTSALKISLEK